MTWPVMSLHRVHLASMIAPAASPVLRINTPFACRVARAARQPCRQVFAPSRKRMNPPRARWPSIPGKGTERHPAGCMPASVYPATMRRAPSRPFPPTRPAFRDASSISAGGRRTAPGRSVRARRASARGRNCLGIMENRRHGRGKASTAAKKPQVGTCGRAGCCGTASLPPQGGEGKPKRHPSDAAGWPAPPVRRVKRRQPGHLSEVESSRIEPDWSAPVRVVRVIRVVCVVCVIRVSQHGAAWVGFRKACPVCTPLRNAVNDGTHAPINAPARCAFSGA